ncbi:MAG: type IV toxin-antitoxin system AbiEi family antitoxin domain-containing protein [Deltaproteobacteria bacterium]|nr:type IV toxin-antitoxin system AbiEi family antitoxin domain-containing protein [Deltaproteobacteria bacterium]
MTPAVALARLRELKTPIITTSDAAAVLGLSAEASSQALRRLTKIGLVQHVRRGLWVIDGDVEPLLLVDHLTAPYPSYVSFQTALYLHGMITQIPAMTYVASLGRAARIRTAAGTFSVHRIAPDFFGGFEVRADAVKLATPEKALLDVLYLSGQRGRLFGALPELEIPRGFRRAFAESWIRRIQTPRLATLVRAKLEAILARAR